MELGKDPQAPRARTHALPVTGGSWKPIGPPGPVPVFQEGAAINISGPRMLIPTTPAPPCLFPVYSNWGRRSSSTAGGQPGQPQAQTHSHTHTHTLG